MASALISPDRLREATAVSSKGIDALFGNPTTWALGFSIGRLGSTAEDSPTAFGLGGVGGSFAYGDTATGIAIAVTKNRLTPDFSAATQLSRLVSKVVPRG